MHLDARGLPISTASGKAAAAYDYLVTGSLTQIMRHVPERLIAWLLAHSSIARFAMKGPRCAATW